MTTLRRRFGTGWPGVCALCALILLSGCRRKPGAESDSGKLVDATVPAEDPDAVHHIISEDIEILKPAPIPQPQPVRFDHDESRLRPDQIEIVEIAFQIMRTHPKLEFVLEGHADERGSTEYNLHLGERRAMAVRDYLVKGGIDPSRLKIVSKGEEDPTDPAHTEEAWAKNRRVEFFRIK